MYLSDMHTHSIASGHGTECTITNMARAAAEKGLRLLGITDHGPGTLAAGTSSYFRSLTYSPKKHFGVELLYGIELNIRNYYVNLITPLPACMPGITAAVPEPKTQKLLSM